MLNVIECDERLRKDEGSHQFRMKHTKNDLKDYCTLNIHLCYMHKREFGVSERERERERSGARTKRI